MEGAITAPLIAREPTEKEVKHARANLPIAGTSSLGKMLAGRLPAKQVPLDTLTVDQSLELLNNAIRIRLQSGPYGLIRCWSQFREKAGGTYAGINFEQFKEALNKYGLPVPEKVSREIFGRMDENGNGIICSQEFIDVVMRRWDKKVVTGHERAHKAKSISEEMAETEEKKYFNDGYLDISTEAKFHNMPELKYAKMLLILKIVAGMKGGAFGVMRMWTNFRNKCGGTNQGVTYVEFQHGLKMYGLNFKPSIQRTLFDSIDGNYSDHIQIFEFIDNLMGRWSADYNSMQELGKHEEDALMALSREIAANKLKKEAFLKSKKQKDEDDKLEMWRRNKKKPGRVPIWKRSQRPATASAGPTTTLKPLGAETRLEMKTSKLRLKPRKAPVPGLPRNKLAMAKSRSTNRVSVGPWRPGNTVNTQGVGDWSSFKDEIGQQHLQKELVTYKRQLDSTKKSIEDRFQWK